jgi:hypothetical protein
MGEMRNAYKIWWENLKGRDRIEELGGDGETILNWIFEEYVGSGQGTASGFREHGNEPWGFIKGGEFLD